MTRRVLFGIMAISVMLASLGGWLVDLTAAAGGGISTIAGANTFCGDGGPAASACLNLPTGIAFNAAGDLFIVDNSNHHVRKVGAGTTTITTLAGNGSGTYCGDPGPAAGACLNFPVAAAVDAAGNVYVADSNNNRVRKIDTSNNITTFAGGVCPAANNGDAGPAASACLNSPRGLAFDALGNLYISDSLHNDIRKVDTTPSHIITTVAGSNTSGFNGDGGPATAARLNHPRGIKLDSAGHLFIADENNNRVRRVDAGTQVISTVAGNSNAPGFSGNGGAATAALLSHPRGIALDGLNNLYIADSDNDQVRKVVTGVDGLVNGVGVETISQFAGNNTSTFCGDGGAAISACINSPDDLASNAGNLYITGALDHRIRKVDGLGNISTYAGSQTWCGDNGPAASACLNDPQGVERRGPTDPLYIADTVNHRIRRVDPISGQIANYAGTGVPGFGGDSGPATSAQLYSPRGITADAAGNLYVADTTNNRIRKITPGVTPVITTVAGTGTPGFTGDGGLATAATLNLPRDVFFESAIPNNRLWIADTANNAIRVVDLTTGVITTIAGAATATNCFTPQMPATVACFNAPNGIFVDATGLYVADTGNQKVRWVHLGTAPNFTTIDTINAGGGLATDSGDGSFANLANIHEPTSIVKDASGNLLVSAHSGDRIRKITGALLTTATISTLVGGPTTNPLAPSGLCGDGGPPALACVTLPRAIAIDTAGNLYIADQGNRRIREVANNASSVGGVSEMPDAASLRSAAGSPSSDGGRAWYVLAVATVALAIGAAAAVQVRRRIAVRQRID